MSDALFRDTLQHLGCGVGLREWRQITVAINQAREDPGAACVVGDAIHNIICGHTDINSDQNYGLKGDKPDDMAWKLIFACERLSAWWQHITGL